MKTYACCEHCEHDPGDIDPYDHLQPCDEGCNNPMPGVPRDIA